MIIPKAKRGTYAPSSVSPGNLPKRWREKEFDPFDTVMYPKGFPSDPELMWNIFNFSDETRTIFHAARDRRPKTAHPIARLMYELLRRGMRCPVDVRPFKGTPLSTIVVVVGRSGTGKSEAAKEDASPWPGTTLAAPRWLADLAAAKVPADPQAAAVTVNGITTPSAQPILIPFGFDKTASAGSGQALADLLTVQVGRGDSVVTQMRPHPAVLLGEDELKTLLNAGKSESSTVFPALNNGWTGADIGNNTRTHGDRRASGTYNLFMWAGLQPIYAHELLAMDASGFFQRVFLTAVTDPYRRLDEPKVARPTTHPVPDLDRTLPRGSAFTLCQEVRDALDESTEDADYDHLPDPGAEAKSHATQVRLRIACLGALLHNTLHVCAELWEWSGWLMDHCDRVDAWMRAEAERNLARAATVRGEEQAYVKAAAVSKHDVEQFALADTLTQKLAEAGAAGLSEGELRNKVAATKRSFVGPAMRFLTDKAQTAVLKGRRYYLTTHAPGTPEPVASAPGGSIARPGLALAPAAPSAESPDPNGHAPDATNGFLKPAKDAK